jgi:hypothetical protein
MQAAVAQGQETGQGTVVWAVAGFVLYVVGGMVMLFISLAIAEFVLGSLGIESGAGTRGLSIRNATHPIGWGMMVAAVSMPLGARLVPGLRFGLVGWVVLAIGLALAAITTFLDIEFVRASHGVYDFEYGGFTGFAGPALVAIALAVWAALALPPGQSRILDGLAVAAAAGLMAVLLPSVGDAADGIDVENVPIAVALTADAVFGVVVAALVVRRRREQA